MKKYKGNKSIKSRRDTAVQGTNDSSIVSKWSMSHVGYFQDDYLQFFVGKKARRCPLINRGYYIRAKAMERVFTAFLNQSDLPQKQIISLGAGFDSSYFRLKANGELKDAVYIEVDFPDVVKRKLALIRQNQELQSLLSPCVNPQKLESSSTDLNEHIVFQSRDYILLGVDLTRLDLLTSCLTQTGCDVTRPTLFLSEVALTYMTDSMADSVLAWAARFPNAVFAAYEQIHPGDAFGRVMMAHFDKLGSPLRCINKYPTMAHQIARYVAQGWTDSQAVDMNYFFSHYIHAEELRRINTLEPFDEYETWHLKCSHYTLICAYSGTGQTIAKNIFPALAQGNEPDHTKELKSFDKDLGLIDKFENLKGENILQCITMNDLGAYLRSCNSCSTFLSDSCTPSSNNISELSLECFGDTKAQNENEVSNPNAKRFGLKTCLMDTNCVFITGGFGEVDTKHSRVSGLSCFNIPADNTSLTENADLTKNQASKHGTDTDLIITESNVRCPLSVVEAQMEINDQKGQSDDVDNPKNCVETDLMYHSMSCLSNGTIVIIGGRRSPLKPNTSILTLNLVTPSEKEANAAQGVDKTNGKATSQGAAENNQSVNESKSGREESKTRMKLASYPVDNPELHRWRHSACCITIEGEEYIVIYGGKSKTASALSDCWILNTRTWRWAQVILDSAVIGAVHSHSASVWRNECIISGGLDMDEKPTNHIHCLAMTSQDGCSFQGRITRIETKQNILSRYSHTSTVYKDALYLVGGVSFHTLSPGVTGVHLNTYFVTEYRINIAPGSAPVMLFGHDSVHKDEHVYIVGGGGNCFSFGTHLNQGLNRLTLPSGGSL